jgi:hypothetical protein
MKIKSRMSKADYAEVQNEYETDLSYFLFTLDDISLEEFKQVMTKHINGTKCATKQLQFATTKRSDAYLKVVMNSRPKFKEQMIARKVCCEFALKWPVKVHKKFYK